MIPEVQGQLLRIYVDEGAKHEGKLVHEAIVRLCLKEGLAGATVLRGIAGFGARHRLHKAGIERFSADLPVVVEIVDAADKIARLLPLIRGMTGGGLITLEQVRMIPPTSPTNAD